MSNIVVFGSASQGLVNARRPIIRALRRNGHQVLACAPDMPESRRKSLHSWGIKTATVPLNRESISPFFDLYTLLKLCKLLSSRNIDIVLSYNAKPAVYGTIAAWVVGAKPYIWVTGLGRNYAVDTCRTRLVRNCLDQLYKIVFRMCRVVFFQNIDDPELLRQRGVLSNSVSTCVTNGSGIDTREYTPKPIPGRFRFLCMARLIPEKGIRDYVEAAKLVKNKYSSVSFLLAGHPEPDIPGAISKEEIQEWENESLVDYRGYVEDVRSLIAEASTYVLPTYYREGTPRSILEAMAMGRPIITTTAPGCEGTVEEGRNGWLVPTKNPEKLAEAMLWMVENQNNVEKMGRMSRKMAELKYSAEKVSEKVISSMSV